LTFSCVGVSQPFFGIAEDWACGNSTGGTVATIETEFYLVGAIELNAVSPYTTATDTTAWYGTGAYEVRIVKLDKSGAGLWDLGNGLVAAAGQSVIRSNCVLSSVIADVTNCSRV
jgi:hypothetical protein